MRRFLVRLLVAGCLLLSAGCAPGTGLAPRGGNCYGTDAQPYIDDAFAGTGQEAEFSHIAWDESRCTPGDNMFQLISKQGFIEQACPGYPGGADVAVHEPYCNAHAARLIYDQQGTAPWRATR